MPRFPQLTPDIAPHSNGLETPSIAPKSAKSRQSPRKTAQKRAILDAQSVAVTHWGDAHPSDPWTGRARPAFLYVMYALILCAIPIGLIAAVRPDMAAAIARGMTAYLGALPEPLYALFGTGYLGYTAARTWGKVKGVER